MNIIFFDPLNFGNSAHLDFAGRWLGEQAVQSLSRAMVAAVAEALSYDVSHADGLNCHLPYKLNGEGGSEGAR